MLQKKTMTEIGPFYVSHNLEPARAGTGCSAETRSDIARDCEMLRHFASVASFRNF